MPEDGHVGGARGGPPCAGIILGITCLWLREGEFGVWELES